MVQKVEALVDVDDTSKTYYTEDKDFPAYEREAISQALRIILS